MRGVQNLIYYNGVTCKSRTAISHSRAATRGSLIRPHDCKMLFNEKSLHEENRLEGREIIINVL